ncbi:MAG TPA: GGDEF domain-containing protein [Candidatus Saccharimonadales bacterium]
MSDPERGTVDAGIEQHLTTLEVYAQHEDPALALAASAVREHIAELHHQATHDQLTGAYNRNGFFQEADNLISRAARLGKKVVIHLVDLDGFKAINDREGHAVGDEILLEATEALTPQTANDILARFGGDEFAYLETIEPNQNPEDDIAAADATQQRLTAAIGDASAQNSRGLSYGGSVGRSAVYDAGYALHNLGVILAEADASMYHVKSQVRRRDVA